MKYRYQNKNDPIPSPLDVYKAVILEKILVENFDNDKFSSPSPLIENIDMLVNQA